MGSAACPPRADGTDLGKLLIWSFIAGYSEKFVTGILEQLERSQGREPTN